MAQLVLYILFNFYSAVKKINVNFYSDVLVFSRVSAFLFWVFFTMLCFPKKKKKKYFQDNLVKCTSLCQCSHVKCFAELLCENCKWFYFEFVDLKYLLWAVLMLICLNLKPSLTEVIVLPVLTFCQSKSVNLQHAWFSPMGIHTVFYFFITLISPVLLCTFTECRS